MLIFLQEIALQLFLWLLQLIDGLMEIFSAISGVTSVNYHGQQVNIIEFVIGDSTIGAIFWCIFITAVGLTCIFTIVGLVKNMVANNRTVSTIVGKFFLALLVLFGSARHDGYARGCDTRYFNSKLTFATPCENFPDRQQYKIIDGNFQCLRRKLGQRLFRIEYGCDFFVGK